MGVDNFSVRWSGQIQPRFSENYTFYATADDGVRLRVDGRQLINQWHDQAATEYHSEIELRAGQYYDVEIEYYERGGLATMKLEWESLSQRREAISSARLFPAQVNLRNLPIPAQFRLGQNYPNPFNPATTIEFDLPVASLVNLTLYDMLGHEVTPLIQNAPHAAGSHFVNWYGDNNRNEPLASGLYFYKLHAAPLDGSKPFVATKKMFLIR